MNRILLLPITIPLRVVALELRIARAAAGLALDVATDLAEAALAQRAADGERPPAAPVEPDASVKGTDPAEGARRARRSAAAQRTRARPAAARGAAEAPDVPPASDDVPRPRPRRAARKATAAKPARKRASGPTRGEVAAVREARREAEGEAAAASVGPAAHAGPEIHVDAPWEGYDAMALDEVLARLEDADAATLAAVRLYESGHEARQAILLATETP
jgi:hypothetical protein